MSTRVLIVDDSALARNALKRLLSTEPDMQVVGAAADPFAARDMMLRHSPDVVTLDLELPRMDGLSFLRRIMRYMPTPTVIISSLTGRGSDRALDCLEAGAVAVLDKSSALGPSGDLARVIRGAAKARLRPRVTRRRSKAPASIPDMPGRLLAIGASTGGTEAVSTLLSAMPAGGPGIVITQHMPPGFTGRFAERMNRLLPHTVREAQSGDLVLPRQILLAPGDRHMLVVRRGTHLAVELSDAPPVCYHRPSVDVLFKTVARSAGRSAVGVILTGMGRDGARGLLAMRRAGARTLGQDAESCMVYGMPGAAMAAGAVEAERPLKDLPAAILAALNDQRV